MPLGTDRVPATIYEGRLGDLVVYFVDCPPLYDRDGMFGFGDDETYGKVIDTLIVPPDRSRGNRGMVARWNTYCLWWR